MEEIPRLMSNVGQSQGSVRTNLVERLRNLYSYKGYVSQQVSQPSQTQHSQNERYTKVPLNPRWFDEDYPTTQGNVTVDNKTGTPVWGMFMDPERGVITMGWIEPVQSKRARWSGIYQMDGLYLARNGDHYVTVGPGSESHQ